MSFNKPAPLAAPREMDNMERFSINCWFIISEEQNEDQFLFDQGKCFFSGNKDKMAPVCCP